MRPKLWLTRPLDEANRQGLLQVHAAQRDELESWAQSRTLPVGEVFGARLILPLAAGMSYRKIERKLGASAPTVSKWKSRFEEKGMEGLQGQHQGSKPRRATPGAQARVIRRVIGPNIGWAAQGRKQRNLRFACSGRGTPSLHQ